jgi:hypothetical protein
MDESIPGDIPKQQAVYAILKEIQNSRDDYANSLTGASGRAAGSAT